MHAFPELDTDRLKLRKVAASDIGAICKHANNEKIARNVLNVPYPYKEEDAVAWMNFGWQGFKSRERFVFAIILKETNEFIGAAGLHLNTSHNIAELGYWIGESYWNKGIMTEAVKEVLKFGFEVLKLNKIYATAFIENRSSEKVMINNGMIKEGELKDHYKIADVYKSVSQYRLTKQEYEKTPLTP